jgi:hypothetical protein
MPGSPESLDVAFALACELGFDLAIASAFDDERGFVYDAWLGLPDSRDHLVEIEDQATAAGAAFMAIERGLSLRNGRKGAASVTDAAICNG